MKKKKKKKKATIHILERVWLMVVINFHVVDEFAIIALKQQP